MDSASQVLYEYVLWGWPVRGVVTLAFYAFTFKMTTAILRHIVLAVIGVRRLAKGKEQLVPDPPSRWPSWTRNIMDPVHYPIHLNKMSLRKNALLSAYSGWLSGEKHEVIAGIHSQSGAEAESDNHPVLVRNSVAPLELVEFDAGTMIARFRATDFHDLYNTLLNDTDTTGYPIQFHVLGRGYFDGTATVERYTTGIGGEVLIDLRLTEPQLPKVPAACI